MIKPTVGRTVDFWPHGKQSDDQQPHAAQIAFVFSDTMVNLGFIEHDGRHNNQTSVPLWQGEGERPTGMHCSWMPYQIGQAKAAS